MLFSSTNTRSFVPSIFLTTGTISSHCFYIVYFAAFSGFLICFFISLYYFKILFNETNYLRLIYDSIKALEIKISILFSLVFANNLFFLIIDLYFLIPLFIVQFFNPNAEVAISTRFN